MEAVILAGGLGTRLGDLTKDIPKPMLSFNGKPFLEHLMDFWIQQGVDCFVLSVGYQCAKIKDYFGDEYKKIPLRYSIEKEPLGTGGALALALSKIRTDETFLLLNGDTFFAVDLEKLLAEHKKKNASITMALFSSDKANRYDYVELSEGSEIVQIINRKEKRKVCFANGGVYCLEKKFLQQEWNEVVQKHSLENEDLLFWIQDKKRIYGFLFARDFLDIGTPEDYQKTEAFLNEWFKKKGETYA